MQRSKKLLFKLAAVIFSMSMTLPITSNAMAIPGESAVSSIILSKILVSVNNIWSLLANNINSTVTAASNYMYEVDPSLPTTIAGNVARYGNPKQLGLFSGQPLGRNATGLNTSNESTDQWLNQTISNSSNVQINNLLTKGAENQADLALLPASDNFTQKSIVARITDALPSSSNTNNTDADANLNFDTLIAPLAYTEDVKEIAGKVAKQGTKSQANNFIRLINNIDGPLNSTINWSALSDEQKQKLQSTPNGLQYRALLRSLIAARSAAISNLYTLYAERTIKPGLGLQAGLRDANNKPIVDASPLQVEQYLATRRISNPKWYFDMSQASPATVSRETLFVLAEMQQQLYQLHEDNERIIGTLAIIELLDMYNQKQTLKAQEEKAAKDLGLSSTPSVNTEAMELLNQ